MIKANELRIGNFIEYLNDLYVVDGIRYEEQNPHKYRIEFKTVDGKLRNAKTVNWITPIELTPEILEKAGFVEDQDYLELYGYRSFSHSRPNAYAQISNNVVGISIRPLEEALPVQYLHQLQNLYFALCGEELNIQL